MRTILAIIFMTFATQASAETAFEYNDKEFTVDLQGLYCPPPPNSDYEILHKKQAEYLRERGEKPEVVHKMWCKGPILQKVKIEWFQLSGFNL